MCILNSRGINTIAGYSKRANTKHTRNANTHTVPGLMHLYWASGLVVKPTNGLGERERESPDGKPEAPRI